MYIYISIGMCTHYLRHVLAWAPVPDRGRTGAQRLRVEVRRAGRVCVVVHPVGYTVPEAPGRVVRVRPAAAVAGKVYGARARVSRVKPTVARRAGGAARAAQRERCTHEKFATARQPTGQA